MYYFDLPFRVCHAVRVGLFEGGRFVGNDTLGGMLSSEALRGVDNVN